MLSRNFVHVPANISFEEFLKLTRRAKRKYIVITRTVQGQVYHYVILMKALEEAVERFNPPVTWTTEDALNLHEHDRSVVLDVGEEPSPRMVPALARLDDPHPSVLKNEGRIVGVYDPVANRLNATYEMKGLNFVYQPGVRIPLGVGEGARPTTRDGEPRERGGASVGRTGRRQPRKKAGAGHRALPPGARLQKGARPRGRREAPRYVNVALLGADGGVPLRKDVCLEMGKPYLLRIDIGNLAADTVVENPTSNPFPAERLPISDAGHWLQIVVSSSDFVVRPRPHVLFLPRVGPSWVCDCTPGGDHTCTAGSRRGHLLVEVTAPEVSGYALLRIGVYYENNLLQSQILSASIFETEREGAGYVSSIIDYTLTAELRDLDFLAPRSLNILTNQNPDGSHKLVIKDGMPEALTLNITEGQILGAIRNAREALLDIHMEVFGGKLGAALQRRNRYREDNSKDKDEFVEDLKRLCKVGWELWASLFQQLNPEQGKRLRNLGTKSSMTIQVARPQGSTFVFPWALVYDVPVEEDPAKNTLCEVLDNLEQVFGEDGEPRTSCPYEASHAKGRKICPFGFWGMRHIIETPPSSRDRDLPTSIKVGKAPEIVISRSLDLDLELTKSHVRNVSTLLRGFKVVDADSTGEVLSAFSDSALEIMYFYCHGKREAQTGGAASVAYLEIGEGEQVKPDDITTWCVIASNTGDPWESTPLVFINGCHTTELSPDLLMNFVDAFSTANAAGVIGTEISIFQSVATEAAERFLEGFGKHETVGHALRGVRLAFLKKGNLMGLAYTAFCSTELRLSDA